MDEKTNVMKRKTIQKNEKKKHPYPVRDMNYRHSSVTDA